jgi:hypothetical protein
MASFFSAGGLGPARLRGGAGRVLRRAGVATVLYACLLALFGDPLLPVEALPWAAWVYPLLLAALLAGYGKLLGHRPAEALAALALACWLAVAIWRGYPALQKVVAGLDHLVISLALFAVGVLVSLGKAGLLARWLAERGWLPNRRESLGEGGGLGQAGPAPLSSETRFLLTPPAPFPPGARGEGEWIALRAPHSPALGWPGEGWGAGGAVPGARLCHRPWHRGRPRRPKELRQKRARCATRLFVAQPAPPPPPPGGNGLHCARPTHTAPSPPKPSPQGPGEKARTNRAPLLRDRFKKPRRSKTPAFPRGQPAKMALLKRSLSGRAPASVTLGLQFQTWGLRSAFEYGPGAPGQQGSGCPVGERVQNLPCLPRADELQDLHGPKRAQTLAVEQAGHLASDPPQWPHNPGRTNGSDPGERCLFAEK